MSRKPTQHIELSRPLIVDRVPRKGSHEHIKAESAECKALAQRFNVPAINALSARLHATPWRGGGIKVTGVVEADLEQISVISLDPFRQNVSYPLERYFLPQKHIIDADTEEVEPIIDGLIDLGELVAETLGLELEPYPRKPGESYSASDVEQS